MSCTSFYRLGAANRAVAAAVVVCGSLATTTRGATPVVVTEGRAIYEACGAASVDVWNAVDLIRAANPTYREMLDAAHPKVLDAISASTEAIWPAALGRTRRIVERCLTVANAELARTQSPRIAGRLARVRQHAFAARRQLVRAANLLQEIVPPADPGLNNTNPATPGVIPAPGGATDFAWTNLSPSSDSRIVYVSWTDGSDSNDGLASTRPVKSPQVGANKLRSGYPDWLLFKRGDVWPVSNTLPVYNAQGNPGSGFNNGFAVYSSGRSASEPTVVWTYGTSTTRPKFEDGRIATQGTVNNVAFVGLHYRRLDENNSLVGSGFQPSASTNMLLEDCLFEGYSTALNIQGATATSMVNLKIRGNVVVDSYTQYGGASQGMLLTGANGALLEGNVFDHNGWKSGLTGAQATIYNHNMYIQYGSAGIEVRNNITARASSHGLQLRTGGVCEENLFLQNPIAILFGNDHALANTGGTLAQNVILDGGNIDASNQRGWVADIIGITSSLDVHHNVAAHNTSGGQPRMFELGGYAAGAAWGNVTIRDNVNYRFGPTLFFTTNGGGTNYIRNNRTDVSSGAVLYTLMTFDPSKYVLSNNAWQSGSTQTTWFNTNSTTRNLSAWASFSGETGSTAGAPSFPDSTRNIASYMATLGGTQTVDAFLTEARQLSRLGTPRPEYMANRVNAYIRAGFGVSGN